MALILSDRVRETTTTTGTGAFSLGGAATGYRAFSSVMANADTTYYTCAGQGTSEWEVGIGTWNTGNTLSRTTILASSNGGSAVTFSAGTKDIFITYTAAKVVIQDASGNVGIGTSSPAAPLSFASATGQKIRFYNVLSGYGIGVESSEFRFVTDNGAVFTWGIGTYASPSEQMRLTSTGLGIGTSLPAYGVDVQRSGTPARIGMTAAGSGLSPDLLFNRARGTLSVPTVANANAGLGNLYFAGYDGASYLLSTQIAVTQEATATTGILQSRLTISNQDSSGVLTERLRLDSSGNLGLGVTPSAWGASFKAIQLANGVSYASTSDPSLQITQNGYYDGTNWRFIANGYATNYQHYSGQHIWRVSSASGTAGNAITFTNSMTLNTLSELTVIGNVRSPIFYDSNDTTYYADPNSISSFYGLGIRGDQASTATENQIFFWNLNTTTSAIGFKSNGGYFTNPTGNGDGYNTYFTMDYPGRGWVFREGVGGSNFGAVYTSGWILNNGIWQANASMRAPIFYDSNDTGYYIDPASPSNTALRMRGGALFGPNTTWGAYLSVGTNGHASGSYASVVTTNGNLHLDAVSGSSTYLNYYAGSNVYFGNGASGGIYAQIGSDGSFRSPIFYDYNNTAYYVDPAVGSNLAGTITMNGGKLLVQSDSGAYGQVQINSSNTSTEASLVFSSGGSGQNSGGYTYAGVIGLGAYGLPKSNLYFGCSYSGPAFFIPWTGDYAQAQGSFRAPIFYDSDNTAYYIDPNTTATSINVRGEITNPSIWINDGDNSNAYNENIRLFNAPNGVSVIAFSASGTSGTPTTSILGYSDRLEIRYSSDWQQRTFNGYVEAAGSFRAPIFYDSNNTSYYGDFASTSNLNRLLIQPRIDNYYVGNVSGTDPVSNWQSLTDTTGQFIVSQFNNITSGAFTNYPPSVYTYGSVISTRTANHSFQLYTSHTGDITYKTQWNNDNYSGWLYPMVYGRTNGAGGAVYGTIFYDQNNTAYYGDFASTSVLNSATIETEALFSRGSTRTRKIVLYDASVGNNYQFYGFGIESSTLVNSVYSTGDAFRYYAGTSSTTRNEIGSLTGTGIFSVASDVRAPIFYDSNDTGYYLNPNGSSSLSGGTFNATVNFSANTYSAFMYGSGSTAGSSTIGLQVFSTGGSGAIMAFHRGGYYAVNMGLDSDNVIRIGGWSASANLWQLDMSGNGYYLGSSRAPIFYDNNNTAYYGDFASSGLALIVNGNIECTARSASWAEGIRINVPTSSTWGGIRITRGASTGNWAIGFTALNATDDLTFYSGTNSNIALNLDHSGNLIARGNVTAYGSPSDRRLKENIRPIEKALDTVLKLMGRTFDWKPGSHEHDMVGLRVDLGFIADEVKEVVPEMVREGNDGYLSIRDRGFAALLVEAIKEQQTQIEALRAELNALRAA